MLSRALTSMAASTRPPGDQVNFARLHAAAPRQDSAAAQPEMPETQQLRALPAAKRAGAGRRDSWVASRQQQRAPIDVAALAAGGHRHRLAGVAHAHLLQRRLELLVERRGG